MIFQNFPFYPIITFFHFSLPPPILREGTKTQISLRVCFSSLVDECGSIYVMSKKNKNNSKKNPGKKGKKRRKAIRVNPKKHKKKEIDDYVLGELIGKGGFAYVYKATNKKTHDFIAVKQISTSKCTPEQIEGIQREITLLQNLIHESIVLYIGHKQTKRKLYIFMEYVANGSLLEIVRKYGPLNETLVAKYIREVLSGLVFLHECGIIHRDIKGANILMSSDNKIKLADFGVAAKLKDKIADKVKKGATDPAGTPYWMAPEIIELNPPSTASDIWSVGATTIELLTGHPPYFNLQAMPALYRICKDPLPPIPKFISKECKNFLELCFQKKPSLRPSSKELMNHIWIKKNLLNMDLDLSQAENSPLTQPFFSFSKKNKMDRVIKRKIEISNLTKNDGIKQLKRLDDDNDNFENELSYNIGRVVNIKDVKYQNIKDLVSLKGDENDFTQFKTEFLDSEEDENFKDIFRGLSKEKLLKVLEKKFGENCCVEVVDENVFDDMEVDEIKIQDITEFSRIVSEM